MYKKDSEFGKLIAQPEHKKLATNSKDFFLQVFLTGYNPT